LEFDTSNQDFFDVGSVVGVDTDDADREG
jgi:hypothetical protein